jgi:hypothetical protein
MEAERASETLVYSFILTRLMAREDFIATTGLSIRIMFHGINLDTLSYKFFSTSKNGRRMKTTKIHHKLQPFVNRCLIIIISSRWSEVISNHNLWDKTKQKPVSTDI